MMGTTHIINRPKNTLTNPRRQHLRSNPLDISPGDTIRRRWRSIIAAVSRTSNIHCVNFPNRNNAAALTCVAIETVVPFEFEAVASERRAKNFDRSALLGVGRGWNPEGEVGPLGTAGAAGEEVEDLCGHCGWYCAFIFLTSQAVR